MTSSGERGSEFVLTGPRTALPVASPEFAYFTLNELRARWASVRDDERRFARILEEVERERVFERWPVDQPYGSLDALCHGELGVSVEDAKRTIADCAADRSRMAAIATTGQVLPQGQGETGNFPVSPQAVRGAESGISDRTQRKLDYVARKRPDLHAAVKRRELSVDRAYRQAKELPPKTSVSVTVEGFVGIIQKRLNREQISDLVRRLMEA